MLAWLVRISFILYSICFREIIFLRWLKEGKKKENRLTPELISFQLMMMINTAELLFWMIFKLHFEVTLVRRKPELWCLFSVKAVLGWRGNSVCYWDVLFDESCDCFKLHVQCSLKWPHFLWYCRKRPKYWLSSDICEPISFILGVAFDAMRLSSLVLFQVLCFWVAGLWGKQTFAIICFSRIITVMKSCSSLANVDRLSICSSVFLFLLHQYKSEEVILEMAQLSLWAF